MQENGKEVGFDEPFDHPRIPDWCPMRGKRKNFHPKWVKIKSKVKEKNITRLKIGTRVVGPDGPGVVTAHVAKHDIAVDLKKGGSALYCQDINCKEYEAVYPLLQMKEPKRKHGRST